MSATVDDFRAIGSLGGFVIGGSTSQYRRRAYAAVGLRFRSELKSYPKSPSNRNVRSEIPPTELLLQTPKEPVLEVDAPRLEPSQATAEAALPVIHFFEPSASSIESFVKAYNGKGFDHFALRLLGGLLSKADAKEILSRAVEGALIATFQYAMVGEEQRVTLRANHMQVLKQALKRRVPKLPAHQQEQLSENLLCQLKDELAMGRKLAIDGAIVSTERGALVADIHVNDMQDEADAQYALAA